jgi:hypothetical protein
MLRKNNFLTKKKKKKKERLSKYAPQPDFDVHKYTRMFTHGSRTRFRNDLNRNWHSKSACSKKQRILTRSAGKRTPVRPARAVVRCFAKDKKRREQALLQ